MRRNGVLDARCGGRRNADILKECGGVDSPLFRLPDSCLSCCRGYDPFLTCSVQVIPCNFVNPDHPRSETSYPLYEPTLIKQSAYLRVPPLPSISMSHLSSAAWFHKSFLSFLLLSPITCSSISGSGFTETSTTCHTSPPPTPVHPSEPSSAHNRGWISRDSLRRRGGGEPAAAEGEAVAGAGRAAEQGVGLWEVTIR